MTRPELHRPIRLSRVPRDGMAVVVDAAEPERVALAARMSLPAIYALRCRFVLPHPDDGVVAATGRFEARVVQTCVVSLEDFEADIAEDFAVNFVPAGTETEDPDPELVDEIPYDGATIDLGEAASEQLALSLDPYPRRPGAALPEEETADPRLASLAAWRGAGGNSGGGAR